MDLVGVLSLGTGVIVSGIAIALTIKFYLETAALERSMVLTLAKIETLSVGIQQIQNDLIRSAWDRFVAGSGLDVLAATEIVGGRLGGEQGQVEQQDSAEKEQDAEQEHEREQKLAQEPAHPVLERIVTLDFNAVVALRIVLDYAAVPMPIVALPMRDPMAAPSHALRLPVELFALPLVSFQKALRSLVDAGIADDFKHADNVKRILVQFDVDFVRYWVEHRGEIDSYLHYRASVLLNDILFAESDVLPPQHSTKGE